MSTRLFAVLKSAPYLLALLLFARSSCAQSGRAIGGQQPIVGSRIYLYSAGTGGMGGGATSLLQGAGVTLDSANNGYVTTDSFGNFALTGLYSCPTSDSQIYLVAVGGDSGYGGNNSAITEVSALGQCSDLTASSSVALNALTTVAAAWSLAPFTTAKTGAIATSPSNVQGLKAAFNTANHLVSSSNGLVSTVAADGSSPIPAAEINTLGNILASCVNSDGSSPCITLFHDATPTGGTPPSNTFQAALNISAFPGKNVADLYALMPATVFDQVFQPVLTTAPHDWTITIPFTGGGLANPTALAVDAVGDIWVLNNGTNSLSEFNNLGLTQHPTAITGTSFSSMSSLAIDFSGNVWTANCSDGCGNQTADLLKFDGSGTLLSPAAGYPLSGASSATSVAIDLNSNIWVSSDVDNLVVELDASGNALSGPGGFSSRSLSAPFALGFDSHNDLWLPNRIGNTLTKFSSSGSEISGSPFSGASLSSPAAMAVDFGNNIWIANANENVVSEFRANGQLATISTYTGAGVRTPQALAVDGSGSVWIANGNDTVSAISGTGSSISSVSGYKTSSFDSLTAIAIDSSGNVWVASCGKLCGGMGNGALVEVVGAASPVVTPLVSAIKTNPTPPTATARCNDWTYSESANRSGTCSEHGGVMEWLTL